MEEEHWYNAEENHTLRKETENVSETRETISQTAEESNEKQDAVQPWRDCSYVPRQASFNSWIMPERLISKVML